MLSMDTGDVPRIYRFVVTVDGEEIGNITQYVDDIDDATRRVREAFDDAYPDQEITVEAFPA